MNSKISNQSNIVEFKGAFVFGVACAKRQTFVIFPVNIKKNNERININSEMRKFTKPNCRST